MTKLPGKTIVATGSESVVKQNETLAYIIQGPGNPRLSKFGAN